MTKEVKEVEEAKDIQGKLNAAFQKAGAWFGAEGDAKVKVGDNDKNLLDSFKLEFDGDIHLPGPIPTTIDGALGIISKVPQLVGGKGVPIYFTVESLASYKDALHIKSAQARFFREFRRGPIAIYSAILP